MGSESKTWCERCNCDYGGSGRTECPRCKPEKEKERQYRREIAPVLMAAFILNVGLYDSLPEVAKQAVHCADDLIKALRETEDGIH